jgi:hypothetical protein
VRRIFVANDSRNRAEITLPPANLRGMDDADSKSSQNVNPYRFERDDALETFARGVIDEAIAKSTASPRQFGYYSMMAARQIAQYVLSNFSRRKADG